MAEEALVFRCVAEVNNQTATGKTNWQKSSVGRFNCRLG